MPTSLTGITALIFVIDGVISFLGVTPTLFYALTNRKLPTLLGIRLLGGPFEALGIDGLITAGLVFLVVSGMKFMAAYWLSKSMLDGAVLGLILLALSTIFWYGFALPYEVLLWIIEIVMLGLVWKSLI